MCLCFFSYSVLMESITPWRPPSSTPLREVSVVSSTISQVKHHTVLTLILFYNYYLLKSCFHSFKERGGVDEKQPPH